MKKLTLITGLLLACRFLTAQNAWINEFHYDNDGTDVGEFIEVVIENPGSYDLSDFSVVLYNGANGSQYDSDELSTFTVGSTEGDFTFYYLDYPSNGIQNGNPDGLTLAYQGTLIPGQFLSYGGTFTAIGGVADGETSVDIGVQEGSSTPVGHSLQLTGTGTQYSDFSWQPPAPNTKGALNNGQSFGIPSTVANPTAFTATAASSGQIDLSWNLNGNGDDVMVAFNTNSTFGTPAGGSTYAVNDPIPGGGTVICNGCGTSASHTGLNPSTQYFYRAWSVDGSANYSSGVSDNATTYAAGSVSPGDIIITEIMKDPADVLDNAGEWLEIFNTTATDIDINGWTISDDGTDSHTISSGGPLMVPAGGFLVLGRSTVTATNGGVPVDYAYGSDITLANGDDELILTTPAMVEIDRVEYDDGTNWPDLTGKSMIFIGLPSEDNNLGSLWIESYTREAGYTTNTENDLGSPGTNGLFQNLITTTTWTGTGNWSAGNPPAGAAANWSSGSPGKHVDVIINGSVTIDLPTGSLQASCGNLTVEAGGSLTVDTNNGITVNGILTENGGTITLESGAAVDVE
jgi:hypothetical protein